MNTMRGARGEDDETVMEEALGSCPIPREQLKPVLEELSQLAVTIDELVALPLASVQALASGKSDSVPLDQLLTWLKDLQQKTDENVQLSELAALLCTHGRASCGAKSAAVEVCHPSPPYIVSLRGSCSWGQWVSAAGGHWLELGTRSDPYPPTDNERWELHRVDRDVYAFKSVGQHKWLTAESNGIVRVNRDQRDAWEAWQLQLQEPWGEGQCNIALRSHHGRFLCQEPPGFPTWNPAYWGGAGHRCCHGILHNVADRLAPQAWGTFTLTDGDGNSLPSWMWDMIKK